jgi:LacI family transcriptional regulator
VTGLGSGLSEYGTDLFLTVVPPGQSELSVVQHLVRDRRADALLLARVSEEDPRVAYLLECGFPFVAHGRVLNAQTEYSWLDTDGRSAFAEAFDMLYGLGHRHFALATISEPMTFRRFRADGLDMAIVRTGDPTVRLDIATSPRFDREERFREINRLLTRRNRPTAILALFDGLAIAVLQEAARLGLRVPEGISVIGFDNIPLAEHVPPGLTTFDTAIHDSAKDMATMLMRGLSERGGEPETRLIQPRLVLRGSHGPAPKN